jgi:hypothetical protein
MDQRSGIDQRSTSHAAAGGSQLKEADRLLGEGFECRREVSEATALKAEIAITIGRSRYREPT